MGATTFIVCIVCVMLYYMGLYFYDRQKKKQPKKPTTPRFVGVVYVLQRMYFRIGGIVMERMVWL
jgi:hypothetical protein